MTSAELAARMGEGWKPGNDPQISASKGYCDVQRWPGRDVRWHARFQNALMSANATASTPEGAVRSCLRSVVQRMAVTSRDLEAILPGVTE